MDTVNVIYDARHPERYGELLGEFITQGIVKFKFWDCVMVDNIEESICLSHKMIVRDAKERGLPSCIIMEDDCFFPNKNGWNFFLENEPKDYDLYLSCSYIPPISQGIVCGFHLYKISSKFYDKFLSIPDRCHVDTCMNDLGGDYKFCYPHPALQRVSWSANNRAISNYNEVLNKEDIYQ